MNSIIKQIYSKKPPCVYIEPKYLFDIYNREPIDTNSNNKGYLLNNILFIEEIGIIVYTTSWISARGEEEDRGNLVYLKDPQIYFYYYKPEKYNKIRK